MSDISDSSDKRTERIKKYSKKREELLDKNDYIEYNSDDEEKDETNIDDNVRNTVIHSSKNETIDKIVELLTKNSDLKCKVLTLTNERDNLEEHLRKTILEYQTKNVLFEDLEKENKKHKEEIVKYTERIVKVRNKCLLRKKQFYTTSTVLLFSIFEHIFPKYMKNILLSKIIPLFNYILYSDTVVLTIVKNIIIISLISTIIIKYYKK